MNPIPFSVPSVFDAGLKDGSLLRFGAIIKDSGTGQIVAHVQETGLGQQIFSGLTSSAFSPVNGLLNSGSSVYTNIQLSQLKTMVESLQVLQFANLGVSLAGIGVSVIGFAIMNKRLHTLEKQISQLTERMDQHFHNLYERELRKHYSQISVLLDKASLAGSLKNSSDEWISVSSRLADESGFFKGEITHLLEQDRFNTDLFTSMVRSFALCNASQVECLMLANEMPAAHKASDIVGQNYQALFNELSSTTLASKSLPNEKGWDERNYNKLRQKHIELNDLVQGVKDATDAALTKPFLIETLIDKGIDGNTYLTALQEEKKHPIILLDHS